MPEAPGLYRALVRDNDDSATAHPHRGCLKVYVPQVHGPDLPDEKLPWAEPCGDCYGLLAIPPVGAAVWVAFEQNDIKRPVWLGSWFGESDMPDEALADAAVGVRYPDIALLKMAGGIRIRISGDKRLEIGFGGGTATLEFDSVQGKVNLETNAWAVAVKSLAGQVSLQAGPSANTQSVEIDPALGEVRINAGHLKIDADNITLVSRGAFTVRATAASQNSSSRASGWERH